jgi:tRNA pseudouridine38-40 synthase
MATFKITLAYDGSGFVGWQRQAAGMSIQGLLEDALRELDQRDVTVFGAGRTDAGVHALGQVASFSVDRAMAADALVRALNARLPDTIRVLAAAAVPDAFHARFDARRKAYRYRMWNGQVMSPFERDRAWHLIGALDVDRMAAAARVIEGRHDFAAFQGAGAATRTTEREVFSSRIATADTEGRADAAFDGALIIYEITGNGFLRHMVRTVVGTLVEIGRGRHAAEWMRDVLASRDRARAGPTAPAAGLFLAGVEYD